MTVYIWLGGSMSSTQMHVLYSENRMLGDVLGSRPTGHMSNLLKKWHFIRGTQLNLWKMTSSGLFLFFQWCKSYFVQVNVGRKQRIKGAGVEERERERERERRERGREGGRVYMLLPCGCSPCPQSQFELLVWVNMHRTNYFVKCVFCYTVSTFFY